MQKETLERTTGRTVPTAGERIRIAFCIDNMQVGGTELNAVRTAERLDPSRYDLRVVSLQGHGPLLSRYRAAGIPVDCFPLNSLYGPGALRQGIRLRRYLRAHRIQILHAHDIYSLVFAIPWARLAGVRTIASRRWWRALPGAHWRLATRAGYHFADLTLANSPRVAGLVERMEGLRRERIFVVPNFLDEEAFRILPGAEREQLRAGLGIAPGERVVGIVANLLAVKDHATLIRAFARLARGFPDVKLVLVGEGPCREALSRLATELGLAGRTVFAGTRPHAPNPHALFEVSVLCSTSEGLPNSLLEAMAAGRPVVATEVGAIPDIVVPGENGLLVRPSDPEHLAGAIAELLRDPAAAERMGQAGRQRAEREHRPEVALAALDRLYLAVLGRASERGPAPAARRVAAGSRS